MSWDSGATLDEIVQTGLLGRLTSEDNGFFTFERAPLLLSKKEEAIARAGRAIWLDQPAGWFAAKGSDINSLAGWIPDCIAARPFLATSSSSCWKCGDSTPVHCLALPQGHLSLEFRDDDEDDGESEGAVEWRLADCGTFISNLTLVNGSVQRYLKTACPSYCLDFSKKAEGSYFMNHCKHCGAKLGDFFMHNEPGGAFFPTTEGAARGITLRSIDATLLACGGTSVQSPDYMPCCTVQP